MLGTIVAGILIAYCVIGAARSLPRILLWLFVLWCIGAALGGH